MVSGKPSSRASARRRDLLLERLVAGDPVVLLGSRALDRDLDVVEPGLLQRLGALAREQRAGGDQRAVQPGLARSPRTSSPSPSHHRLAAGERELEHAEPARLAEDAHPVLGRELVAVLRAPMSSGFEQYGQWSGHWYESSAIEASSGLGGCIDHHSLLAIASTSSRTSSSTSAPS